MEHNIIEAGLPIENMENIMNIFGDYDQNLKVMEDEFGTDIIIREGEIKIIGEEKSVGMVRKVFDILLKQQE
ncbi:MAG TPA: phosphate starvation-inducible protein PhoH, partial [Clostridia bacterium]|nr:phosphate starvation-inducible protein PhoH [Clostridia bacterium]